MSHDQSLAFWTRLLAVTFLTTGQVLRADDQPSDSHDTKIVPIKSGDSTLNVQVKEPSNPYRNVSSSDSSDSGSANKYQPDQINYASTSPLAHKQFLPADTSISKSASIQKENEESTFITKSYFAGAAPEAEHSTANIDNQVSVPTSNAYNRSTAAFNKGFTTASFDPSQNQEAAALASKTSTDQDHTAVLGTQTINTPALAIGSKTFEPPEADNMSHARRAGTGIMNYNDLKNLPNRPLTIDEVRALINHDVKPDTNEQPEPPTKALNDPDYKPEVSPAPPASDDDKNDPVPPPGTMAAPPPPENSEPLPNH